MIWCCLTQSSYNKVTRRTLYYSAKIENSWNKTICLNCPTNSRQSKQAQTWPTGSRQFPNETTLHWPKQAQISDYIYHRTILQRLWCDPYIQQWQKHFAAPATMAWRHFWRERYDGHAAWHGQFGPFGTSNHVPSLVGLCGHGWAWDTFSPEESSGNND